MPVPLENNPESERPEVLHFWPSVPTIPAGNKKDLPNSPHTLLELAKAKQAGRQEDYDRLRPLSYSYTAGILVHFSIDSHVSREAGASSRMSPGRPEVLHFCSSVPIIVAGNKKDLPNSPHTLLELAKAKQAGRQEDYDRLRPLSYSYTAGILVHFSID
ncbi:ras-like GTP-binding protein Rho1 [Dermacentor silvarum]|uniref:ras-like GTP-binding protein Rho1 n=1 Tax=Dermacentor silvarum TaxID=543639 RepID=UPI002101C3AC|nr:ras-like GTP-binding protein Rho1 [Dermacentor silvarum]